MQKRPHYGGWEDTEFIFETVIASSDSSEYIISTGTTSYDISYTSVQTDYRLFRSFDSTEQ